MRSAGVQNPSAVVMVRPRFFGVNPQTAADNRFQAEIGTADSRAAVRQFDAFARQLEDRGVVVHVFDGNDPEAPDAVFPNNWFSLGPSGALVTYPMLAPSRRRERRGDILAALEKTYAVQERIDLSSEEAEGCYLEGTGAIVFDHDARLAFMAASRRADPGLFERLCKRLGYAPILFHTRDEAGLPIYHTNVMLSIGERVVLFGADCIGNEAEREWVRSRFSPNALVVDLPAASIAAFSANALELDGRDGPFLAISQTGWQGMEQRHRDAILRKLPVLTPDLSMIERSGGSARCMLAGIHAPGR
jgi:hypothetical protein